MSTLLRALAKLVFAAALPTPEKPPSNLASMIKQCEAKGRADLGEQILAQWAKVFEKYPQTRINWATACALSGNSVKKNVFGGAEFVDWLAKELKTEPDGKNIPCVAIPAGTPAIAIPKKDETPEDWAAAAEETAHMLKDAESAFASVGEFTDYLEKEIGDLQRKLAEYGPGGEKSKLKSGKPHSFVSRLPKWAAQLKEYDKKLASVRESVAKSGEKFKTAAKDYDSARVTTVAFESKVQDSLVDVLAFILDVKDLKKQRALLDKFQENLKNMENKSAASVTADASEFLASIWEKVLGYWDSVFAWAKNLTGAVHSFSSIVHIMGPDEVEASTAAAEFEHEDVWDLAEALDYWLQHNWEGQGDELYRAHCELTEPGVYKPSPMSKFENMEASAKDIYDSLTRTNYKEALDLVINFDPDKEVNAANTEMLCEDFYDTCPDEFDTYIDEMFWEGSYSSDKLFGFLKELAKDSGVTLKDENDFNYDKFFHELYKNSEKGLS